MSQPPSEQFTFDAPAIYQIRVQGRIKASWSDRLEGMTISVAVPEDGPAETTLEGELPDQSALAGVLNSLYELHLSVLEVRRMSVVGPGSH